MTKQNEKDAKRVPELRFKGFADAWEQRKLGDLGSVQMNKRIFKDQTSESGEVPFFKIGTFGKKPDSFISKKLFDEYKSKYPYPKVGDILISASGSIGRTVFYKGEDAYFQDSNIVWLEHDGRLKNSFLEQFLKRTKWNKIEGSTIKRLYNKDILNKKINLPKLKEQEKIGQLFQYLDKTITLHEEKHRQLEQLKKALLQKMFADETGYPLLRFKGFTEKWEQVELNDIAPVTMGQSPNSKNYTENPNNYILVQGNADLFNGQVLPRIYTTQVTKVAHVGDILMSVRAPVGNIAQTQYDVVIGRGVAAISGNLFIKQLLNKMDKAGYWNKYIAGSTFESVNSNDIKSANIKVPKLEEQEKIGQLFQSLDKTITLHDKKIQYLKQLKRGLLQKVFI